MELETYMTVALAALFGMVVGAAGLWLRLMRRLKDAAERVKHLEAQRLHAAQQNTTARRQAEGLQREVAELRQLMMRRGIQPPPREGMATMGEAVDAAIAAEGDGFQATQSTNRDGFQPTQILGRTE